MRLVSTVNDDHEFGPVKTAPFDGAGIVHDHGLVMHPMIQSAEVKNQIGLSHRAPDAWVKKADINIRMLGQCDHGTVRSGNIHIINQATDAHSTLSSPHDMISQDATNGIRRPNIVLNVERLLRIVGEGNTVREGLTISLDHSKA